MEFTRVIFLFFIFPVFFLIYYLIPTKFKNFFILLTSLFIVFWSSPVLSWCMIFFTLLNFILCRYIYSSTLIKSKRNYAFLCAVFINLLAFALYLGFDLNKFMFFEQKLIVWAMIPLLVLSNTSYILDVYTKKCTPQKNIIDYFTYIFMFPKLFLGPLTSYHKIQNQLKNRHVTWQKISDGIGLTIIGLAEICILAGGVLEIQKLILYQNVSSISVFTAWVGAVAMFFNIYFNLAGYANMARGLGKMIGFELPFNFRCPISSNSITNFFERWNISLLCFIKTYVEDFFKQKSKILNIFIGGLIYAWFFGGNINKFVAAIYFILILIFENLVLFKIWKKISLVIRKFTTFILVLIGTVFIATDSLWDSLTYIGVMFGANGVLIDKSTAVLTSSFISTFGLCWIFASKFFQNKLAKFQKKCDKIYYPLKLSIIIILFVFSCAFCLNN